MLTYFAMLFLLEIIAASAIMIIGIENAGMQKKESKGSNVKKFETKIAA